MNEEAIEDYKRLLIEKYESLCDKMKYWEPDPEEFGLQIPPNYYEEIDSLVDKIKIIDRSWKSRKEIENSKPKWKKI